MSPKNVLIALASAASILLPALQSSNAAVISLGPYTVSTTMPFIVPIVVTGANDLASWTFDLHYDASDIAINTTCDPFADPFCSLLTGPVTEGPFFAGVAAFPTLFVPGFILLDPSLEQIGELLGVSGAWQDPGAGVSGDGILAYVEFVTRDGRAGTTPITIVGPSVVPEPTTLALAGVGLIAIFARRRHHARVPSFARA